jgi:hypothetical protein
MDKQDRTKALQAEIIEVKALSPRGLAIALNSMADAPRSVTAIRRTALLRVAADTIWNLED